jgi:hypothetical protein
MSQSPFQGRGPGRPRKKRRNFTEESLDSGDGKQISK